MANDKGVSLAKEAIVQINTITSAVLAITLTFRQNLTRATHSTDIDILKASWGLFALALVAGVASIHVLAGLEYRTGQGTPSDIKNGLLRVLWGAQTLAFLVAMVLFAIFGIRVY